MTHDLLPTKNWHFESASAYAADSAIELSNYSDPSKVAMELCADHTRAVTVNRGGRPQVLSNPTRNAKSAYSWLPFCSEVYNISADLSNYVIVPVAVVVSDLPNRNLVAFPFERLTEFNPEMGMLGYQTWARKPTFIDHNNADHTKAKGVILDVGLRPLSKAEGNLYKVVNLCAFDRSVDPLLASSILSGEVKEYSMGAMVNGYTCSICSARAMKPTEPKCMHIPADRKKLNVYPVKGHPTLAHWRVGSFRGFETSALVRALPGAFPSAVNTAADLMMLK